MRTSISKLLPEPLGVISRNKIIRSSLQRARSALFKYLLVKSRNNKKFTKTKHQWDINTMKKNLISGKEKYAVLRQDPRNQAYLGAEFLSTLVEEISDRNRKTLRTS
ncbi:hypothetical protein HUG17_6601 [Dermatophagoides farinae]|uniref:Uncharacterized protein n=1 Tax=Dermatophagoides farinae TaxID=6954 RepID=A0A9D4P655_DERFA|nr:hypothetical protein HUG17_6601 [Dermatophagoides farinae]